MPKHIIFVPVLCLAGLVERINLDNISTGLKKNIIRKFKTIHQFWNVGKKSLEYSKHLLEQAR